jgi:hypothetical protein
MHDDIKHANFAAADFSSLPFAKLFTIANVRVRKNWLRPFFCVTAAAAECIIFE